MNQYKRAEKIEKFKALNEVNNISQIDSDDDGSFSMHGCDICRCGGTNVYACDGYSPKHGALELGDVCHECLCIEANGVERE